MLFSKIKRALFISTQSSHRLIKKINAHVLYCRVWLSNDRANQSSMIDYAQEYIDHGIQVLCCSCY